MKQHKRSGVVAVAVLWAVMAWAVGTKGKADMPTLDWLGREEAVKQDKAVPLRVLREVAELGFAAEGVAPEAASGVLVQGDNLEALRALLPFYAGEVKCIYIDPPYNTGSAFEHYDDNLDLRRTSPRPTAYLGSRYAVPFYGICGPERTAPSVAGL